MLGEEWLTRPWTGKLLLLGTPPILLNKNMAIKRQKQAVVSKTLVAIGFSDVDLAFKFFYQDEVAKKQTAHQVRSSSAALRDDLPSKKRLNHEIVPTFFFLFESSNYFPLQPAMGRKRKAGGRSSAHGEPADITQEKALLRINTYKDVADSEDEFFDNQDKILLAEGPALKRQRKAQEDGIKNGFSGMCCSNN